jgi:hypothetical protein
MKTGALPLVLPRADSFAHPHVDVTTAFRAWLVANGHLDSTHCAGCAAYYPMSPIRAAPASE